jgi:hypothetical protein
MRIDWIVKLRYTDATGQKAKYITIDDLAGGLVLGRGKDDSSVNVSVQSGCEAAAGPRTKGPGSLGVMLTMTSIPQNIFSSVSAFPSPKLTI